MTIAPAWIVLNSADDERICIYKRIAGKPKLVAENLLTALEYGRRGLTINEFAARICCAIGDKSIRPVEIHPNVDHRRATFHYDIFFVDRGLPDIQLIERSDGGDERIVYRGRLENFLAKELRKPKKRRIRDESLELMPDTNADELEIEARRRQAQREAPHVDLSGVRVFTKEEVMARRNEERALRKVSRTAIRRRDNVKK